MGEARRVVDELTAAATARRNPDAAADCYAEDAFVTTPDAGTIRGRAGIADYWRTFVEAFPDSRYEPVRAHEVGAVAVHEGWRVGANTAPLRLPTGGVVRPTGRQIRLWSCDVATVRCGRITEHRLFWDQPELLRQLGLISPGPSPRVTRPPTLFTVATGLLAWTERAALRGADR